MQQYTKRWLVGMLAVAAAGGFAWLHRTVPLHASVAELAAAAPPAVPPRRPAVLAPSPAAAMLPPSLPLRGDAPPVGVQVERLLATHDPQAAYAAYQLVAGCIWFNTRHDVDVYDDKRRTYRGLNPDERQHLDTMCGGMTERERQARLDYLGAAVKAGVSGAAWDFMTAGPFGDPSALKTRPDDPLVRAWKATAVAQMDRAAETGDPSMLILWGMQNLGGSDFADKNPALAYRYLIAFGFIAGDRAGPNDATATTYADGSPVMNAFGFGLTPEQRAIEQAAARRIADEAKARRQRQG
jgi:hypothetical protein